MGCDYGDCMQKVIKAGEFKAKCLGLMDEVAQTGDSYLITKNGKEIAELVPPTHKKSIFGLHQGLITWQSDEDLMSPCLPDWTADDTN
jgi:prevent-host-death family protein